MLDYGTPEVRICGDNIGVHVSEADFGEGFGSRRTPQGACVVCSDGNGATDIGRQDRNNGVGRRVLNDVKRYVPKVALVGDAPPPAKSCLSIAEEVVSNAHARTKVVPVFLPQSMNRAIRDCGYAAVADVGEDITPLGIIVVRIQVRVFVMLDAKVVPTYSQIKRQPVRCFPRILEIGAEFVITVAPSENWRTNREGDGATRHNSRCAAREFSLWVNSRLELPKDAVQEVFNACTEVRRAEGLDGFLVRPETPVVSDVGVIAAKPERVTSMDRAEILVSLDKVLWAPEGDRIARCEG